MELTLTSYIHIAGALLFIFLALTGWGWIAARLLRLTRQPDFSMLPALGMAISAVLGGIFSLLGIVSPTMTHLYLAAGTGATAMMLIINRRQLSATGTNLVTYLRKNPLVLLPGILAIGLLMITILQSGLSHFNTHDDFHAYLVFPSKMIQTGSFGVDPFNERRMMVLGGHCFLQALVLGTIDLRYLNLLEMGIGWLVFILLIAGYGIKRNLSAYVWLSLIIIMHFMTLPLLNASSAVTGAALFLALMRAFFFTRSESTAQRVLMLAILTAGLCALKNSHFVGAGMLLLLVYLYSQKTNWKAHIYEFLFVVITTGVFLAPWMLEMMLSSGTFLYPVFGKGYHGSAYGSFPSASAGEFSLIWLYHSIRYIVLSKSLIWGLLLTVVIVRNKEVLAFQRRLILAIFVGSWISAFLIVLTSGLGRYAFPVTLSCTFLLTMYFLALPATGKWTASRQRKALFRIGILAIMFILYGWTGVASHPSSRFKIRFQTQSQWTPAEFVQYKQVLDSVPAGAQVLVRVSKPFLFDFKRNEIFTVDWPGGASPPPGLPLMQDAEKIAAFLLEKSIRYVVYSYEDEAGYPYAKYRDRLTWQYGYLTRTRDLSIHTFMFHKRLMDMNKYFKKIYDDGSIWVLDLAQKTDA